MRLDLADKFLSRFHYDLITLQVLPPTKNGKEVWPTKSGKHIATGKSGSSVVTFNGALSKQPLVADLVNLQKQRVSVYFMVNEGDGKLHDYKTARNSKAVQVLKALFVDTDNGDPKKLQAFCRKHKIKPHSIVRTSPGRYHYYFFLEDTEATKENVDLWKACQQKLAEIDPNFDASMADLSRVLRIPGFYHTKKEKFLIKEIYAKTHKNYLLDSLYRRIGAETTFTEKSEKFSYPRNKLTAGARHAAMSAFLGYLSNTIRSREDLICAGIGFAHRYFVSGHEWAVDGNRHRELLNQVDFVLNERAKEDLANSLTSLEIKQTSQGFKNLPDEYYYGAPGIVGEITKELCDYSPNPYPAFTFAAALSMVGAIKAPYIRGELFDTPPCLYSMCLAESGRGKDFPRAMITRVFIRLGYSDCLIQNLRSAQGFLKSLGETNGALLILHDEADHFFSQLNKSDNDYITTFRPMLLQLYSRSNDIFKVGRVMDAKQNIPPIVCPALNYCGFGVPTGFEEAFQISALHNGMFTRNLIFRDHRPVLSTRGQTGKLPKVFAFEKSLRELAHTLDSRKTRDLLGKSKEQIDADLKAMPVHFKLPMTVDGREAFDSYSESIAAFRNNPTTASTLGLLRSRSVEQVNRMAVIMAKDKITADLIQYCIPIVDNCYDNVKGHVESFSKGQGNREIDKLVDFIADRNRINKGPMQAQELRNFYILNKHTLENTLAMAIDMQRVQKITNYRKPGVTTGRVSTAYLALESI